MKKSVILIVLLAIVASFYSGCDGASAQPSVISDLAYKTARPEDCLVYIEEDGEYVPYII